SSGLIVRSGGTLSNLGSEEGGRCQPRALKKRPLRPSCALFGHHKVDHASIPAVAKSVQLVRWQVRKSNDQTMKSSFSRSETVAVQRFRGAADREKTA